MERTSSATLTRHLILYCFRLSSVMPPIPVKKTCSSKAEMLEKGAESSNLRCTEVLGSLIMAVRSLFVRKASMANLERTTGLQRELSFLPSALFFLFGEQQQHPIAIQFN